MAKRAASASPSRTRALELSQVAFLLLQGVVVRQGRELERQRRHVEVEALRDAHGRLEELDLRLLEDLGRRRDERMIADLRLARRVGRKRLQI